MGCVHAEKELNHVFKIRTRQWGSMQKSPRPPIATDLLMDRSLPSITQGRDHPRCRLSGPYASLPWPSGWLPASLLVDKGNTQQMTHTSLPTFIWGTSWWMVVQITLVINTPHPTASTAEGSRLWSLQIARFSLSSVPLTLYRQVPVTSSTKIAQTT